MLSIAKPLVLNAHFILLNLIAFGWICAIPIMVDHIQSLFGDSATFFQLVLLSTVVGLLTNIPFGRLVDKTSSRQVLAIGLFLNLIFWLILAQTTNPYGIIVAFTIEGAAFSALLIARAPYFHELISTLRTPDHYHKLESDAKVGMLVVMLGLLLGGGYLYQRSPALPFYLNALIVFAASILVLLYARHPLTQTGQTSDLKANIVQDMKALAKQHPNVFWISTSEGFFAALTPYFFFVVNIHLLESGATVLFISYLIAAVYGSRIIGAYLVRHSSSPRGTLVSLVGLALFTLLMAWSNNPWWIAGFFLAGSVFKEFVEVYLIAEVTQSSPQHLKGSIRSYSELLSNAGIIAIMIVMSLYADKLSSGLWIGIYSGLFLVTLLFYFLSNKKERAVNPS